LFTTFLKTFLLTESKDEQLIYSFFSQQAIQKLMKNYFIKVLQQHQVLHQQTTFYFNALQLMNHSFLHWNNNGKDSGLHLLQMSTKILSTHLHQPEWWNNPWEFVADDSRFWFSFYYPCGPFWEWGVFM